MTDSREEDERASGNHELEPKARPASGGPWDPLASFRKTISPTQRMELLKMKVPVLPPEDFMDTADFQRARAARTRRFMPLIVGLGGALLVLLFVGLWSRFWSTPSRPVESTRPPIAPIEAPRAAAISNAVPTAASPAHVDTPASPTLTTAVAPVEPPSAKAAAKSPSVEVGTPKSLDASPPSVPRSKPALLPPKTSTPPNPEPAPSGINFWTQPR
jgi:hypothetical protein